VPTRAYKASAAYATAHVKANLWLWIVICLVAVAIAVVLRKGTVAAFLGMALGILVMMKGEEGYVRPEVEDEDEDELPLVAAPAPTQV
jgi:hypothetical protein